MKRVAKKRKEAMVTRQLRLPRALLMDLEEFASQDGRTISGLLRKIAEDFVRAGRDHKQRLKS
jgi:hypothetical protein